MAQAWRKWGVGAVAVIMLSLGWSTSGWAGMRQERIRQDRAQVRYDRGTIRGPEGSHASLKSATQALRAGRADLNAKIRAGDYGEKLTRKEKRDIRSQALGGLREGRFNAARDHKYNKSVLSVDRAILATDQGKKNPLARDPNGKWEKVAPPASKRARVDTKAWIKEDKALIRGPDGSKARVQAAHEALKAGTGTRADMVDAKRTLRRDRMILNVHRDQLKQEQGYRWVVEKDGGLLDDLMGTTVGGIVGAATGNPVAGGAAGCAVSGGC